MNRILLSVIAALLLIVGPLWWQVDRQAGMITKVSVQRDAATARADSLRTTLRLQRELNADLSELDRKHTEGLSHANAELEELRGRVGDGSERLLVKASCPAAGMSATTGASGVDDAGTAELHPAARQDYFALRGQLTRTEAALAGLQAYVSTVCRYESRTEYQ
ncbi:lysis protein [Halopseudomonas bauzanensis]|uniref:lysis protein n=1 Tax=Halopseudomonas bauzanensis TaxID=653930 RepID=UPI002555C552|nr:lysis protein [Halopseudomonas bauzanensis]